MVTDTCNKLTLAIGIFSLTESTSDKSISATTMPVDKRSEKEHKANHGILQTLV